MADLNHQLGNDLSFGPSGDLALVAGSPETVQRILKRLITNTKEYIWHTRYGGGLGKFIGESASESRIQGVIERQIKREKTVANNPAPIVNVTVRQDGYVFVSLQYADATNGQNQTLQFTVSNT